MINQGSNLHSLSLLTLCFVVLTQTWTPTKGVIMQQRLLSANLEEIFPINKSRSNQDEPESVDKYEIRLNTISNSPEYNVLSGSPGFLAVYLNALYGRDVYVNVTVHSRPDLILWQPIVDPTSQQVLTDGNKTITVHYKPDQFGDIIVNFKTLGAGHATVLCQTNDSHIDNSTAFISVNIAHSDTVNVLINIVGWAYFLAWSSSFYFQVLLNYQKKSVIGLNFDFLLLNIFGFTCYSVYNLCMLLSSRVQQDYYWRNEFTRIPVEYSDLFFSLHAFLLCGITIAQCYIYEVSLEVDAARRITHRLQKANAPVYPQRGTQTVSGYAKMFVTLASTLIVVMSILYATHGIKVLDLVNCISYIKLVITLIKYAPQAYMNHKRRSTTGWSIHNILLDFTGGLLSLSQMFMLAANYDNWANIFGNFTKFGLALFSIMFDLLFMAQHYVLYANTRNNQSNCMVSDSADTDSEAPEAVISQSIRDQSTSRPEYDSQEDARKSKALQDQGDIV